eukprot:gene6086-12279_t
MLSSDSLRKELEAELAVVRNEEERIDHELRQYFAAVSGGRSLQKKSQMYESEDVSTYVSKIERFAPCFEAMEVDAKKLASQVEDCRTLSDRLSIIVRRLDNMQIHAQQALACTEDVINLKQCKIGVQQAIEDGNLQLAVSYVRQVHDIELQAAKASDDYGAMQQAEREVRMLVQKEFNSAINESNINAVISLCPLLQTLGLENEARDSFLHFMETNIFIAISSDAANVDNATDAVTAYAQALSNVFNTGCTILQQYLPAVIQGMENSLADIYFIRKLHLKCEQESGLILKRYLKYRNVKDLIISLKSITGNSPKFITLSAELHTVLDELALLIQYCCSYSKYLKELCTGAEDRRSTRKSHLQHQLQPSGKMQQSSSMASSTVTSSPSSSHGQILVFSGPTDFDKMVDELINRFYMEGENWLMKAGLRAILSRGSTSSSSGSGIGSGSGGGVTDDGNREQERLQLDEGFFILQRCGQRAIGTSNIHAACAILHQITDLLSSDLLKHMTEMLNTAVVRLSTILGDNMARFVRSQQELDSSPGLEGSISAVRLSKGIQSALSLASSIAIAGAGAVGGKDRSGGGNDGDGDNDGEFNGLRSQTQDEDDPWGTAAQMEVFGAAETCMRYTDRLGRDLGEAGVTVFQGGQGIDRLKLCKEDFDTAKASFSQVLKRALDQLASHAQNSMRDVLSRVLGRQGGGPLGGIKFDVPDDVFDNQPALTLLPRSLTMPFDTMISICTTGLGESSKDIMTSFRFAGALKLEECVRALNALFSKWSSTSIRGKFSRIREIMLVLTSDVSSSGNLSTDNFSHLTINEIHAFASLRIDFGENNSTPPRSRLPNNFYFLIFTKNNNSLVFLSIDDIISSHRFGGNPLCSEDLTQNKPGMFIPFMLHSSIASHIYRLDQDNYIDLKHGLKEKKHLYRDDGNLSSVCLEYTQKSSMMQL